MLGKWTTLVWKDYPLMACLSENRKPGQSRVGVRRTARDSTPGTVPGRTWHELALGTTLCSTHRHSLDQPN